MWNRRKWHSILLVGLVLLLASSVVGCAQSYTQEDLDAAREAGYNTGFTESYKAGLAQSGVETVIPPSTIPTPSSQPVTIPSPSETPSQTPTTSGILWSEAINHIGERTTVYGLVIGATYASSSKGQPTFLNVGKNYPDPARFTVLIWGSNRSKFSPAPEIQYKGKMIYVSGLIEDYKGSAQIQVKDPSQIQVK